MAGVNKNRIGHDDVYEATVAIAGGLLVVPATGAINPGKQGIAIAGDGADDVLGVSARLAQPTALTVGSTTDGDGYPVLEVSPVNELTTVYKRCVVDVTYTAAAVGFGAKLVAAANGHVRAYVSLAEAAGTEATSLTGDDPSAIIGECRVVGGMGSGGGVGKAYIY